MLFYEMGNGDFIAEAGRGTKRRIILELQKEEWSRRKGGISRIGELTEPRAIWQAFGD